MPEFALEQFRQKTIRLTTDGSGAGVCRQFLVGRMQTRAADMRKRLELTTKGENVGVRRQFFPFGITIMRRDARRAEKFFRASLFISVRPGCNPGHWVKWPPTLLPCRPQRLTASFRGAKSSHKAGAAENALSPARRPAPLLPAARKGLRLRFGEQKVHTRRRRKTL